MPDTYCRACGAKVKIMAVCISCGQAVLYVCPQCATFSETKVHIGCLQQSSIISEEI